MMTPTKTKQSSDLKKPESKNAVRIAPRKRPFGRIETRYRNDY